jgi:O-antigen/teichoic acid export membrane protein
LAILRQGGWYVITPLLGVVSPLLALPVITSQFGADGWAAIAVGQALGAFAAVVVEMGWGLTGPQQVSRLPVEEALKVLRSATSGKALILSALVLPTGGCVVLLAPAFPLAALCSAVGAAMSGLTVGWYFQGRGEPMRVLFCDGIPRILCVVGAAGAMTVGAPLVTFGIALGAGAIGGLLVAAKLCQAPVVTVRFREFGVMDALRGQGMQVAARLVSSVYIALPTVAVAALFPSATASFSAIDRLARMALAVLQAVPTSMQRWIGRSEAKDLANVIRFTFWINAVVGLLAGICFFLAAPAAIRLMFSGEIPVSGPLCGAAGVLVGLTCMSRGVGSLVLVRLGMTHVILMSTIVGALAIGPLLGFGLSAGQATGAMVAVASTELCVLATQACVLVQRKKA